MAASDGAIWYVTDESIVRIADGTESVVARRAGEPLPGELMVNVNIVAAGEGGPERADPRPREIGPDTVRRTDRPRADGQQTLYGDGDITCPDHWAHDLSLPVGQVQYTPTPQGIEITVTLTEAWPDTEYYVEVNTDEFCQDRAIGRPADRGVGHRPGWGRIVDVDVHGDPDRCATTPRRGTPRRRRRRRLGAAHGARDPVVRRPRDRRAGRTRRLGGALPVDP